jgi:hypothetical protein
VTFAVQRLSCSDCPSRPRKGSIMPLTCRNLISEYWASSEPVSAPSVHARRHPQCQERPSAQRRTGFPQGAVIVIFPPTTGLRSFSVQLNSTKRFISVTRLNLSVMRHDEARAIGSSMVS